MNSYPSAYAVDLEKIPVRRLNYDPMTGRHGLATPKARFIRGPIPLDWASQAFALPGKTAAVAMALWFMKGVKGSETFLVNREVERIAGCHRHSLYAALDALETAGLVRLDRRRGRRTQATLLPAPGTEVSTHGEENHGNQ